jgi:nucleoside-diphosphate kinase
MKELKQEQTLVLVKPDGVMRGLVGEVINRFETRGLKIVALKMLTVDRKHLDNHFPKDEKWITRLGEKTLGTYKEYKLDPVKDFGTDKPEDIGPKVRGFLFDYMTSGPIVAMVVEGMHARDMVRKIAGNTLPVFADVGTIRGDYSVDSPAIANVEQRGIKNIVHASETAEEAANEIGLWFDKSELHDYKRSLDDVAYS